MHFSKIKSQVDDYIAANRFDLSPSELYDPLNYIIGIGGKRLRPVSLLLAHQMFSNDIGHSLPAAYAIELFHNFSLIHDDIMDEAPLRRGHTTVHHKWDMNTAILSGDAMLIYSYQYLNRACSPNNCIDVHRIFSNTAIEVCEGQQMDVNFETQASVSQQDYITMIYKKTGALIEGAMQIGATLAGAQKEDVNLIGQFAKNIGISFQLQDDILDTYGERAAVGKRIGGDIIQNKKTILYLLALEAANEGQKKELVKMFSGTSLSNEHKVSRTMKIFDDLDIRQKAEALRDQYHRQAFISINGMGVEEVDRQPMIDFVDQLLIRDF